jgi:hypothetical protein
MERIKNSNYSLIAIVPSRVGPVVMLILVHSSSITALANNAS